MKTITEGSYIDLFVTYKFLRVLTIPWEKQEAFKLGIIDGDGKRIKSKKIKTSEEKDNYTMLHRLVFNFKRILHKIPFVKSKIGTYAAALFLLKEHMDEKEYKVLVEHIIESGRLDRELTETIDKLTKREALYILEDESMADEIKEDAPVNNMGDGKIAKKDNVMKFDGRTKKFKSIMRRIRERKVKETEKAYKDRLLQMGIKESLLEKKDYEAFFKKAMKKFKVKDINDMSDKEKDKFFNYIDKNWDAKDESVNEKAAEFLRLNFKDNKTVKKVDKWVYKNISQSNSGFMSMIPDESGNSIEWEDINDADELMSILKKAGFKFKVDMRE